MGSSNRARRGSQAGGGIATCKDGCITVVSDKRIENKITNITRFPSKRTKSRECATSYAQSTRLRATTKDQPPCSTCNRRVSDLGFVRRRTTDTRGQGTIEARADRAALNNGMKNGLLQLSRGGFGVDTHGAFSSRFHIARISQLVRRTLLISMGIKCTTQRMVAYNRPYRDEGQDGCDKMTYVRH